MENGVCSQEIALEERTYASLYTIYVYVRNNIKRKSPLKQKESPYERLTRKNSYVYTPLDRFIDLVCLP